MRFPRKALDKFLVFLKNARFGAVQVAFAFGPNKKFAVS